MPSHFSVLVPLCLSVAAQHIHDFVGHQLLDVFTGGLQILAGVKVRRMVIEILPNGSGHRQTQVGVNFDLTDRHRRGLAELVLRLSLIHI